MSSEHDVSEGDRSAHFRIVCTIVTLLLVVICIKAFGKEKAHSTDAPAQMNREPELFCGERLDYDMGFWLFRNAAAAHLTFSKKSQGFEALFEAETTGLSRIITGHKKEMMRSVMEFDEGTRRFRPLTFQELFTDGRRQMDKRLTFNYYDNTYTISMKMDKRSIFSKTKTLPTVAFDDLLTFFYNLRIGHYGPVEPGLSFEVCLLMSVRPSYLGIMFRNDENGGCPEAYYDAVFNMEKMLTQARSKTVSCRLSHDLIPVYGVVKDAYYFGDLTVRLRRRDVTAIP